MKKSTGFSLIELLISLIVISLIIATFMPILSKKIKSREIVFSGAKQIKIDCSKFDTSQGTCLLCTEQECSLCSSSINVPDGYYVNPNNTCDRKNCSDFDIKCKRCTKDGCQECENGYALNANKRCYQKTCNAGYYVSGSSCSSCIGETYQPDDNSTASSCISCSDGKKANSTHTECVDNRTYQEPTSQSDCDKFNALYIPASLNGTNGKGLCVTKKNAGDGGSGTPTIPSSITITTVGGVACAKTLKCCWSGKTAGTCTTDLTKITVAAGKSFTYDACNRTTCNWTAAEEICKNHSPAGSRNWRLPTGVELTAWKTAINAESVTNYKITRFMGSDGLQLCGGMNNGMHKKGAPRCDYSDKCKNSGSDNHCDPFFIWGRGIDDKKAYRARFGFSSDGTYKGFEVANVEKIWSTGVRCVTSEVLK